VIRLVIDPGVFISALIGPPGSPPDQIVQAWIDDRIELIASPVLLAGIRRVIARPKFRRWFDELTARHKEGRARQHRGAAAKAPRPPTRGHSEARREGSPRPTLPTRRVPHAGGIGRLRGVPIPALSMVIGLHDWRVQQVA
jgi:hypothetical protein